MLTCCQALADLRAELDAVREAYVAARAEREQAEAGAEDARGEAARLMKRLEAKLETAAVRCAVTHHRNARASEHILSHVVVLVGRCQSMCPCGSTLPCKPSAI